MFLGWPLLASGSVSQRHGSGSLYQAKIANLDSWYCFVISLWLFIFEKWCNFTFKKKNKQKNLGKKYFFVGVLKVNEENSRIRSPSGSLSPRGGSGSVSKCHRSPSVSKCHRSPTQLKRIRLDPHNWSPNIMRRQATISRRSVSSSAALRRSSSPSPPGSSWREPPSAPGSQSRNMAHQNTVEEHGLNPKNPHGWSNGQFIKVQLYCSHV